MNYHAWLSDSCTFKYGPSLSFGLPCPSSVRWCLFYFTFYVLLLSLRSLFLSNEKEKRSRSRWQGSYGGTGKRKRRGNCNIDLLHMRESILNKREDRKKNMIGKEKKRKTKTNPIFLLSIRNQALKIDATLKWRDILKKKKKFFPQVGPGSKQESLSYYLTN